MPMPNAQPVLPVEGVFTDLEHLFISEEPSGILPENQNSNWGTLRKVLTDEMTVALSQVSDMFSTLFIDTATTDIGKWEQDLGVPDGSAFPIPHRRAALNSRRTIAAFTRKRIRTLIESYLGDTFGAPVEFTVGGISLVGGIELHAESISPPQAYRVYEDIRNFSYQVWIINTVTPDMISLTRELKWMTPAHLALTIDNTKANILSYFRAVINKQPVWYGRLAGNANDSSGYANNGALNGAPAAQASPGLLVATTNDDTAGYNFDGVDDWISVPNATQLNVGDRFSIETWINVDTIAGNRRILSKGGMSYEVYIEPGGAIRLQRAFDAVIVAHSSINLVINTTYHVVITKNGSTVKIFINGVDRTALDNPATVFTDNTNALEIGRLNGGASNFLDGRIDEVSVYNEALTAAQVLDNYNTGKNIA